MSQEETGYETTSLEGGDPQEVAFLQSENHEFDRVKLEPYSPMRLVAAQAMGLHHGRVDAAGMEQFDRISVYPGAVRDVCIVLWLCSIKDQFVDGDLIRSADVQIDQAARAPVHAAKLAIEWGTAHGIIDPTSDKFGDAFGLFFRIMKEIKDSYSAPKKKQDNKQLTQGK